MQEDSMGVAVPKDLRWVERPAAIIVPCLGFNEDGFRLGYGGGFYDRTLAALPRPASVGVCYACQRAVFTVDAHDIALDLIVTE
jgi:5,10-methenyltetrahydrofolate synthetase